MTEKSLLAQTGKIELDDYLEGIMISLEKHELWRELRNVFPAKFKPIKESFDLLEELQGKFVLAMLVNTELGVHDEWDKIYDHKKYFDVIIDSSKVGLVKPDPKIYHLALSKLGVKNSEVLFIDDSKVNILGAQKIGIETVYFKDPVESIKEIRHRLGLV